MKDLKNYRYKRKFFFFFKLQTPITDVFLEQRCSTEVKPGKWTRQEKSQDGGLLTTISMCFSLNLFQKEEQLSSQANFYDIHP